MRRKPGDLLSPWCLDQAVFDTLRREMGAAVFNCQYQQNPITPKGSPLRWEWFAPSRPWKIVAGSKWSFQAEIRAYAQIPDLTSRPVRPWWRAPPKSWLICASHRENPTAKQGWRLLRVLQLCHGFLANLVFRTPSNRLRTFSFQTERHHRFRSLECTNMISGAQPSYATQHNGTQQAISGKIPAVPFARHTNSRATACIEVGEWGTVLFEYARRGINAQTALGVE